MAGAAVQLVDGLHNRLACSHDPMLSPQETPVKTSLIRLIHHSRIAVSRHPAALREERDRSSLLPEMLPGQKAGQGHQVDFPKSHPEFPEHTYPIRCPGHSHPVDTCPSAGSFSLPPHAQFCNFAPGLPGQRGAPCGQRGKTSGDKLS